MKKILDRISNYFTGIRKEKHLTSLSIEDKQDKLIRLGREQFQKLLDKGLSIPVTTL